jgi:hypothetical protein
MFMGRRIPVKKVKDKASKRLSALSALCADNADKGNDA